MFSCFLHNFPSFLDNITVKNQWLNKIIQEYSFFYVSKPDDLSNNISIYHNIKSSNFVLIKEFKEKNKDNILIQYIIIGFKNTIIFIEKSLSSILEPLLSTRSKLIIYFLSEINDIHINIENAIKKNVKDEENFKKEIENFNNHFSLHNSCGKSSKKIWENIISCISGYLIKESYEKTKINRFNNFDFNLSTSKTSFEILNEDEYINLRTIGLGSVFNVNLIFHIGRKELFALKKQCMNDNELPKLIKREIVNHSNIHHPLMPKFFGTTAKNDSIIMEFINGKTLLDIKSYHLSYNEKINIIFQLMILIEFLHRNHYIYRDLKPNNVMLDSNKTVVLIDFDRIIESGKNYRNISNSDFLSSEILTLYTAPELYSGDFSYECDIYSLGMIIFYIIECKEPTKENLEEFNNLSELSYIKNIINKCIVEKSKRPSIVEIILKFYIKNQRIISNEKLFEMSILKFNEYYNLTEKKISIGKDHIDNLELAQFYLSLIYYKGELAPLNWKKAKKYCFLSLNVNNPETQYTLGKMYEDGVDVPRDINKAIYYYNLASNQKYAPAQFNLGLIYLQNIFVQRDINKSIYYFKLASDNNYIHAQYNLGLFYIKGEFVEYDINKAIYYFKLAADQNDRVSQFQLGLIYKDGELVPIDINKTIYYLTFSANQNYKKAQFQLGLIYEEGRLVPQDIKKAIYYYTLASNQNNLRSHIKLGLLYLQNEFIPRDIEKSIYYLKLASNRNFAVAQCILGFIYSEGKLIQQDVHQSIHYFKLASNQNYSYAQFMLGLIYSQGKIIQPDVDKALHYINLALKNNSREAQYYFGMLHYIGKIVPHDINKAFHYFMLAANQYLPDALFIIAKSYYYGECLPHDINKAYQYFLLLSNQNDPKVNVFLGLIFLEKDFKLRNIDKSIGYFKLASKQNSSHANYILGIIYCSDKFVPRNMNKSIHYFELASNHNYVDAHFNLGLIYEFGYYVPQDINKAIYYYSLASNNNDAKSQYRLGAIFESNAINIKKAIHYYTLSSNQNFAPAQFRLGVIFSFGNLIPQDIIKGLHYIELAAKQKYKDAQTLLGFFYLNNKSIPSDIEKSLHYLSCSANQNDKDAQYILGIIYFFGFVKSSSILKGIDYLIQSAKNGCIRSQFFVGFLYHFGLYVDQDIKKAIHYYKEASSYNCNFAKNNLGIIYKNEFNNLGAAIEYFEEAIKYKNDYISMYNLAHLYFYEEPLKDSIEKSIELLIKSSSKNFYPSKILLCLAAIMQFGVDIDNIIANLKKYQFMTIELSDSIRKIIKFENLEDISVYEEKYNIYHDLEFIYDNLFNVVQPKTIKDFSKKIKNPVTKVCKEAINYHFYEGFGDIL